MELQKLIYVLKISECGSFSRSAKELFISQPTLSQQVLSLEEQLGVKLFLRHPRGVSLTDAGEEFVTYARRIMADVQGLTDSMHSYASKSKGKVRVGVLWVFADLGIAELLSDFQSKYPQFDMQFSVNGSVRLLNMLNDRDTDAIFYIGTELERHKADMLTIKLFESEMSVALPVGHPLTAKKELLFSDLDGQNVILPEKESTIYAIVKGHLSTCGAIPKVVGRSSQTSVSLACAANGIGIAFISSSIANIRADENVVVRPILPAIKRAVYYSVLESSLAIPAVRILTDYIEAEVKAAAL